jgi:hypothetical protein
LSGTWAKVGAVIQGAQSAAIVNKILVAVIGFSNRR